MANKDDGFDLSELFGGGQDSEEDFVKQLAPDKDQLVEKETTETEETESAESVGEESEEAIKSNKEELDENEDGEKKKSVSKKTKKDSTTKTKVEKKRKTDSGEPVNEISLLKEKIAHLEGMIAAGRGGQEIKQETQEVKEAIEDLEISEEDMEILSSGDPKKMADIVKNFGTNVYNMALRQFEQRQTQRENLRNYATQVVTRFYSSFPDLAPYKEWVRIVGDEVGRRYPNRQPHELLDLIGTATRQYLAKNGIQLNKVRDRDEDEDDEEVVEKPTKSRQQGETGETRPIAKKKTLTPFEEELKELTLH